MKLATKQLNGSREELGVTLHSYGDTFSHVTEKTPWIGTTKYWQAYGTKIGHAATRGQYSQTQYGDGNGWGPDFIAERYIDGMYPAYVTGMAGLFGMTPADVTGLLSTMRPTGRIITSSLGMSVFFYRPAYGQEIDDDDQESSMLRTWSGLTDPYHPEGNNHMNTKGKIGFATMSRYIRNLSGLTPLPTFHTGQSVSSFGAF